MRGTGKKILIAEDDLGAAETLREFLELRGMECTVAKSGNEALSLFSEDIDVVILDIHLSDGPDGLELLRRFKVFKPSLFVVIVTASDVEDNRKKSISMGADAFLAKPLDLDSLDGILREIHDYAR
ncbi:response regulator [bacterium]|nr:response regulator [bacterium]